MARKPQKKSKPEKPKKQNASNAKYVFIALAIVVIGLILFLVGRSLLKPKPITPIDVLEGKVNTTEAYTYAKFPFIKKGDVWTTQIQLNGETFDIQRQYGPKEVEDINITYQLNNFSSLLKKYRRVYVSIDPEAPNAYYGVTVATSMILALKEVYAVSPVTACTVNSSTCVGKPIVTCDTTNDYDYAVIQFTTTGPTSVVYRGDCLDIRGSDQNLIRAGDKVIYGWYGLMK